MRAFWAFIKKEWMEGIRSGKLLVLFVVFLLFGIMNPAIAKLTPWMMELMSESLAETGLVVGEIQVDALTSWTQYFKNIPVALIIFVLMYSSIFTKEYQSGTMVLMLTKGLARYKVVLAKGVLMGVLWSCLDGICLAVTYVYNAYFWDNGVVKHLFLVAGNWWLFGIWVISLLVLFSAIFRNNTGVLLGTGGTVLAAYLAGLFPHVQEYMPTALTNTASLLSGAGDVDNYGKAMLITAVLCIVNFIAGIVVMDKKQI